jgi:hypothetical protein
MKAIAVTDHAISEGIMWILSESYSTSNDLFVKTGAVELKMWIQSEIDRRTHILNDSADQSYQPPVSRPYIERVELEKAARDACKDIIFYEKKNYNVYDV